MVWYLGYLPVPLRRLAAAVCIILPFITSATILLLFGAHEQIGYVKLEGIRIALRDTRGRPRLISVGGCFSTSGNCRKKDEIFVPNYPPHAFQLRLKDGALRLKPGRGFDRRVAVSVNGQIKGLQPLLDGDEITIANNKSAPSSFQLRQGGLFGSRVELLSGNALWELPNRKTRIPLTGWEMPLFVFLPWNTRVYPVGQLIAKDQWDRGKGLHSSILFGNRPHPREINGAHILSLEKDLSLNGRELWPYPVHIEDGSSLHFLGLDGIHQPALRPLLSIRKVTLSNNSVVLTFSQPEPVMLAEIKEGERLVISTGRGLREQDRLVKFGNLSDTFSNAIAFLTLGEEFFTMITSHGVKPFPYGQVVEIGDSDQLLVCLITSFARK